MLTFKIESSEINGRFDPRFYNPIFKETIEKIIEKGKKPGYRVIKLGNVVNMKTSAFYGAIAESYGKIGIPFIRVSDVRTFSISPTDLVSIPEIIALENPSIATLRSGDIVITKGGTVGNVAIVPKWMSKCKICRDVIGLEVTGDIRPEYILLFLASRFGMIQIDRMRTQQIQSHLTIEPLKNIKILISDEHEEKISNMLLKVGELGEESLSQIHEAQNKLYESIGIKIYNYNNTNGFSINYNKINDNLTPSYYSPRFLNIIKDLKNQFNTYKIGDIASIQKGNEVGSANYRELIDKEDTDVPFIRTSDIVNYEVDDFPDYYIDNSIYDELDQDIKVNDLLVNNDGKIGFLAILTQEDKCIIQSHIRRMRFSNLDDCYFALAFLSTHYGQLQFERYSFTQATIPTMSGHLSDVIIPEIDSNDKRKIVDLIRKAFEIKSEKKKLLKKTIKDFETALD